MKLETFIAAAKGIDLPSGNYILKSKKSGDLYWFMVYDGNYDATYRELHRKGSNKYSEFTMYYNLWLVFNREWHKKLFNEIRRPV